MTPRDMTRAAAVVRWHSTPEARPETLGQHQWHVAMLLLYYWPDTPAAALREALHHDTHELLTGDMPWHSKQRYPALAIEMGRAEIRARDQLGLGQCRLTESEKAKLKFCDRLAAYLHVQTFTPWLIERPEWITAKAELRSMALALGVEVEW